MLKQTKHTLGHMLHINLEQDAELFPDHFYYTSRIMPTLRRNYRIRKSKEILIV